MSPRSPEQRLLDIQKAIDRINRYVSLDPDLGEVTLDAIVYNLAVIGEAIKDLPDSVKNLAPDAPWSLASKLRDVLIHRYFATDRMVVSTTVEKDLPDLERIVKRLLTELEES